MPDRLCAREYGRPQATRRGGGERTGSLDASALAPVDRLRQTRLLPPRSTFETLRGHAVERYGMADILADPAQLADIEPDVGLLGAPTRLTGRGDPAVREALRRVARSVIGDLLARLRPCVERAMTGGRERFRRSRTASAASLDRARTIRESPTTPGTGRRTLAAGRLAFTSRRRRRPPWTAIAGVDRPGPMTGSLIHAAVMAAIPSACRACGSRWCRSTPASWT